MIRTITSAQVYKQISPTLDDTFIFIFRLKNYGDLESIIEEMSAICDKTAYKYIMKQLASVMVSFM